MGREWGGKQISQIDYITKMVLVNCWTDEKGLRITPESTIGDWTSSASSRMNPLISITEHCLSQHKRNYWTWSELSWMGPDMICLIYTGTNVSFNYTYDDWRNHPNFRWWRLSFGSLRKQIVISSYSCEGLCCTNLPKFLHSNLFHHLTWLEGFARAAKTSWVQST